MGCKIQYKAPLRRVAKDQDCSLRMLVRISQSFRGQEVAQNPVRPSAEADGRYNRYRGPIIFPSLFHIDLRPIKHN